MLPDENVMAVEIGRNNMASQTSSVHYPNMVAYLNSTTTGVLQRGWDVRVMANIATAAEFLHTRVEEFRTLIRNSQFLTAKCL